MSGCVSGLSLPCLCVFRACEGKDGVLGALRLGLSRSWSAYSALLKLAPVQTPNSTVPVHSATVDGPLTNESSKFGQEISQSDQLSFECSDQAEDGEDLDERKRAR